MGKGLNKDGQLVDIKRGKVKVSDRRQSLAWRDVKIAATRALNSTDYLALSDRRPMTDTEKAYRDALRAIVRAPATGLPPILPTL